MDEKKLRADLENPQENVLISAGAGAGKTELMAKAILNKLNGNSELEPSQVVAITFTNAAAEELRERINKKYREFKKKNASFRDIRTDDINISTIHSFCSSLIRQRTFDCGLEVSPAFSEDEAEKEYFIKAFIRQYISDHKNETQYLQEYWGKKTRGIIYDNAFDLLKRPGLDIRSSSDKTAFDTEIRKTWFSDLEPKAEDFCKNQENNIKSHFVTIKKKISDYKTWKNSEKKGHSYYGLFASMTGLVEAVERQQNLLSQKADHADNTDKEKSELLKQMRTDSRYVELVKAVQVLIDDRTASTIRYLSDMYDQFENIRNKTALSMSNILYRTAKLVNDPKAVTYFQDKYKMIFVDEFQDTDHLQLNIILKLFAEDHGLKENSVFFVGDPKQSIYRFRGAEVGFYDLIKEKYFSEKGFYQLRYNYRSQQKILDYVNEHYNNDGVFGYQEGNEKVSTKIGYTAMEMDPDLKRSESASADENTVVSQYAVYDKKGCPAPVSFLSLSGLVEFLIQTKEKEIIIRTAEGNKKRNIEWNDFLILTKRKKEASQIYEALKKNGIPATVMGDTHLSDNRAIMRVVSLVNYMKEQNDLYLAELIAAFSPQGMLLYDNNGTMTEKNGTIFDENTDKQNEQIADRINELLRLANENGPITALYHAFVNGWLTDENVNYISAVSELPVLYQFLEGLFKNACNNIDSVSSYVNDFLTAEHKKTLNPSLKTDCVRVMNLHQAKGLEGNIVINYLTETPSDEIEKISSSDIVRSIFQYIDNKQVNEKPKVWVTVTEKRRYQKDTGEYGQRIHGYHITDESLINNFREEERDELIRMMYVRDTRARSVEYIFFAGEEKISSHRKELPARRMYCLQPHFTGLYHTSSADFCSLSPSALENVPQQTAADQKATADKVKPKISPALYGTIMHRAFELYIENRKLDQDISDEEIVMQAMIENDPDETVFEEYDNIVSDLIRFRDRFEEAYDHPECATETPLFCIYDDNNMPEVIRDSLKVSPENKKKVYFSGYADLTIFTNNTVQIIDHKSDARRENESASDFEKRLSEKYLPQQTAYASAFQEKFAHVEKKMTLYSSKGQEISWIIIPIDSQRYENEKTDA